MVSFLLPPWATRAFTCLFYMLSHCNQSPPFGAGASFRSAWCRVCFKCHLFNTGTKLKPVSLRVALYAVIGRWHIALNFPEGNFFVKSHMTPWHCRMTPWHCRMTLWHKCQFSWGEIFALQGLRLSACCCQLHLFNDNEWKCHTSTYIYRVYIYVYVHN